MSLNIKNSETCRLAEELAALTAENKTEAITVALRERLERERRRRGNLAADLHAIGRRCAALAGPGPSAAEVGAFLYDERGLPK